MKENTLEKFEIEKLHRSQIHGAPYNPRKISAEAERKLKKDLKEIGLLSPIVVNRRTMNIVSGHQRLKAMDSIMRTDDYELTVAIVDMDERQEMRANVLLNNQSVMGEWDTEKLLEMRMAIPELDFKDDLGFDQADLDVMFAGIDDSLVSDFLDNEKQEEIDPLLEQMKKDKFKEAKKAQRQKIQAQNKEESDNAGVGDIDNIVTIVFNTNAEKKDFMRRCAKPVEEKFLKPSILYDIANGKIKMTGRIE